jgi:hypothetical protein
LEEYYEKRGQVYIPQTFGREVVRIPTHSNIDEKECAQAEGDYFESDDYKELDNLLE